MAPLNNSASPPMMTSFELPREERPAVRAKGTVRPSAKPMMASWMISLEPECRSLCAWVFSRKEREDFVRVAGVGRERSSMGGSAGMPWWGGGAVILVGSTDLVGDEGDDRSGG